MGKAFKLKSYNNSNKKKYQPKIIEYVKPVEEYIKPFRKVYFGFYEGEYATPPKFEFLMKPNSIWNK